MGICESLDSGSVQGHREQWEGRGSSRQEQHHATVDIWQDTHSSTLDFIPPALPMLHLE